MECGIVGDMCKDRVRNQFINNKNRRIQYGKVEVTEF